MDKLFRMRETDDTTENRWVVADGQDYASTQSYICHGGAVTANCSVYLNKKDASAALELYLNANPKKQDEMRYGHPRFYEILEAMAELHSRKNHDYAGTSNPLKNLRACERLELKPFIGVMVRLQDKFSRLEQFVIDQQLKVKDESVKDTLMDVAVYSVLAIILLEEEQKYLSDLTETKPGYGGKVKPERRKKIRRNGPVNRRHNQMSSPYARRLTLPRRINKDRRTK